MNTQQDFNDAKRLHNIHINHGLTSVARQMLVNIAVRHGWPVPQAAAQEARKQGLVGASKLVIRP